MITVRLKSFWQKTSNAQDEKGGCQICGFQSWAQCEKVCLLVGVNRASYQYQPVTKDERALRQKIRELALKRHRFGSPRIHLLLRKEGTLINHKRTERIYREEGCPCAREEEER